MPQRKETLRWPALTILTLAMAACGGGDGTEQQTEAPAADAPAPAAVADPATIRGTINFTGTAPANQAIDMSEEATCAEKHPSGATTETVVANDGRLKNVFVRITEAPAGGAGAPSEPVVIDQQGCVYIPHVAGVVTGQGVVFRNSDGILHNIKATPTENRPFNISQPTTMDSPPRTFEVAEVIPVQCDVHGWMQMYLGVVDHPYFAVSGDDGTFEIGNLPAGTYTLEAWHEQYGTQTQQVTVAANQTADVTFDYNATQAGAYVPLGDPIDPHGEHHGHSPARVASATR